MNGDPHVGTLFAFFNSETPCIQFITVTFPVFPAGWNTMQPIREVWPQVHVKVRSSSFIETRCSFECGLFVSAGLSILQAQRTVCQHVKWRALAWSTGVASQCGYIYEILIFHLILVLLTFQLVCLRNFPVASWSYQLHLHYQHPLLPIIGTYIKHSYYISVVFNGSIWILLD